MKTTLCMLIHGNTLAEKKENLKQAMKIYTDIVSYMGENANCLDSNCFEFQMVNSKDMAELSKEFKVSDGSVVESIANFKKKHGHRYWKFAIEEFIRKAPEFCGDEKLAAEIGEMMADLEAALKG